MKTTIELPDDLLIAAKAEAARRRSSLKEMFEHALRREISFPETSPSDAACARNEHGFPVMKRRAKSDVTSEDVYALLENELRDASLFPKVPGSKHLTDIYLLALAVSRQGNLATLDQRIDPQSTPGGAASYFLIPVRSSAAQP